MTRRDLCLGVGGGTCVMSVGFEGLDPENDLRLHRETAEAQNPQVVILAPCPWQAGRRNRSEEQCPEEDPGAGGPHLGPAGGPGLGTGREEQGREAEARPGGGAGGTEDGAGGHAGQHGHPAGAPVRGPRRATLPRWRVCVGGAGRTLTHRVPRALRVPS